MASISNVGLAPYGGTNQAATPSGGPLRAVFNMFAPKRTTPIDRRNVLRIFGAAGITATSATALWNTLAPKSVSVLAAADFVPTDGTVRALAEFATPYRVNQAETDAFLTRHRRLFERTAAAAWTVDELEYYQECNDVASTCQECDPLPNGGQECHSVPCTKEVCVTKSRMVARRHSDRETRIVDDALPRMTADYQAAQRARYADILTTLGHCGARDLMRVEGDATDAGLADLKDADFAARFEAEFQDGHVGLGWQAFITCGLGIPASIGLVLYDRLADAVQGDSNLSREYRDTRTSTRSDSDETVEDTRRAFFQCVAGMAAGGLAWNSIDDYKARSREISGDGVQKMRHAITDGNLRTVDEYFQQLFGSDPAGLLANLTDQIHRLRSLTIDDVRTALDIGIAQLWAQARSMPGFGAYNISYSVEDDYNMADIAQYVAAAHAAASQLERTRAELTAFFAHGVPVALLPAMRAYALTTDIRRIVDAQHHQHHWGLARDVGLIYGIMSATLLISELPGPHHTAVYGLVQGVCDWWDDRLINLWERVQRAHTGQTPAERAAIYQNSGIRAAVVDNIAALQRYADGLVQAGIVEDPELVFLNHYGPEARATLQAQLRRLDVDKVIELYVDKALAYFEKREMSVDGILKAIKTRSLEQRARVKPEIAALRTKVLSFVQGAGAFFIFDLLEGNLIDDNHTDENWLSAETGDLPGLLSYWSERVAGWFTSSQPAFAEIGILPAAWGDISANALHRLRGSDVLDAFQRELAAQLDRPDAIASVRDEIVRTMNRRTTADQRRPRRAVSDEEVAQRALLRELQHAIETHTELDVLLRRLPQLKAAFTAAAELTTE